MILRLRLLNGQSVNMAHFVGYVTNFQKFMVLIPAQEFFTYMETSPLPVKGCKI
jgi:hypothetical protein